MIKADSFVQPLPNYVGKYPLNFAGYVHLQNRGAEGLPNLRHIGDDYNGAGGGNADFGLPVVATANGMVDAIIPWNGNYGFGLHVFVKHFLTDAMARRMKQAYGMDTNILYSHYAHLNSVVVKVGQEVKKGTKIATLGNSGTTLAHLHFDIRKPTGMGFEFYPSGYAVNWVKQYYVTPFTFIEENKTPLVDTPPVNPIQILYDKVQTTMNSSDSIEQKIAKIREILK